MLTLKVFYRQHIFGKLDKFHSEGSVLLWYKRSVLRLHKFLVSFASLPVSEHSFAKTRSSDIRWKAKSYLACQGTVVQAW